MEIFNRAAWAVAKATAVLVFIMAVVGIWTFAGVMIYALARLAFP